MATEARLPATSQPAYTRAGIASRAGVDPGFVDRLCELGILTATGDDFT